MLMGKRTCQEQNEAVVNGEIPALVKRVAQVQRNGQSTIVLLVDRRTSSSLFPTEDEATVYIDFADEANFDCAMTAALLRSGDFITYTVKEDQRCIKTLKITGRRLFG